MIVRPASRSPWLLLFTLKGSIVSIIWKRVVAMMLLATAVVLAEHRLPLSGVGLGAVPLTLVGLTLAIFLGFRNSVAYERWWEARKLWGELLIVIRNLTRQTLSLPDGLPAARQRELAHGLIAYAHALRHMLRQSDPKEDLQPWLPAATATRIMQAENPPSVLLGDLSQAYAQLRREGRLDSILLADIDAQITRLSYIGGGCERIRSTPIPFAYILLLHRTVYIYCLLLPFCLVGSIGWVTPFMVGVLSYTFFGLDALGEQIEEPFDRLPNNLPLDALCRGIEINVGELLGDKNLPPPLSPQDGVLF
ncbi:bestrophin family protein [Achromobacter sp. ACM02]|uniref:bestrophin family protein n=1 Tax=Achromobacter sp. ACM02 TaxID=2769305 RepID=UPI00177BA9B8|nr:bestrophin family protein [Achromobacter sp. ACM02]MBD9385182.1 bestrophin family protein [Achromobacter sp. ACM02]